MAALAVDRTTLGTDTRARLVRVAADLVHAESFHTVGVKAMCDAAGVHRGSFYHFFPSKSALVLEGLEMRWSEFRSEVLGVCRDADLGPKERVLGVIAGVEAASRRDRERTGRVLGCPFGNLASEATTLDESLRLRLATVFAEWAGELAIPLGEAARSGELGPGQDPNRTAVVLLGGIQGLITLAKVQNDPGVIGAGGATLVERVWHVSGGDAA